MNKQWMHILAVVCSALILCPSAAFAANAQQLISQTNDQLNTAVDQAHFLTDTTPQQALSDFANEAPTFVTALEHAITGFQDAAHATSNTSLRGYANRFAQATQGMATAVAGMANSLAAQDSDGLATATGDLDAAVSNYTSAADGYNSYVEGGGSPQATAPWVGNFIIFLVVSAGLLVASVIAWARSKAAEGDPAAAERKNRRGDLALASLLPFIGSVSSYVWYREMAGRGGSYALLYLPILVGFIALGVLYIRYRRAIQALEPVPAPVAAAGLLAAEPGADPKLEGPLLVDRVRYFRKKLGWGMPATVMLYPQWIEVFARPSGAELVRIPLGSITDINANAAGVLRFRAGGQHQSLAFGAAWLAVFGMLGVLISWTGARPKARAWASKLQALAAADGTSPEAEPYPSESVPTYEG